jgi:hypothetical protein
MATTTNYGWTTPNDTDLVKDGAAAIRTLGSSVDTTTKALNPSTTLGDIEYRSATANTNTRLGIGSTGQVLTVAGGVPTWATSDDANAIQNALLTTTGDTIYASGASTPARLGIGSTGQVLTVAGGVPSWATPAAGGAGLTLVSTTTIGSGVSSVVVSGAFSSTYDNYKIIVSGGVASSDANFNLQLGSTTSNYGWYEQVMTTAAPTISGAWIGSTSSFAFGKQSTTLLNGVMEIQCPFLAKATTMTAWGIRNVANVRTAFQYGIIDNTTSYTAFTILSDSTMTGGTIKVYGYQNS